jgi:hypothetical protein
MVRGRGFNFSADGRTLGVVGGDNVVRLWDVPPRTPWGWLVGAAALLAVPPAWLARRRVRKLRRLAEATP